MKISNLSTVLAKEIINERKFFIIRDKDGKSHLYIREGNIVVKQYNEDELKKYCVKRSPSDFLTMTKSILSSTWLMN
jgi:hypothetical protein